MQLTAEQITTFLLALTIMLFSAKLFGEFFIKIKQPAIIGEIFAGIVLGPTILGMIFPEIFEWVFLQDEVALSINSLTTLAVVFLLLVSGLEVDLSVIFKHGKSAALISAMGIIFPFFVGFTVSYFFPAILGGDQTDNHLAFSLFIGTALSISALPVIAKTLIDLDLLKTKLGLIIISSAMVDDFLGWLLFSLILGLIGAGIYGFSFIHTAIFTLLFVLFMLFIGRKLINILLPKVNEKLSFPGSSLNFILILGLLGAGFTEFIGIHAVFGAFIVGVAFGDSVYLKSETKKVLHQFITNIFAPLFFVSIGLKVNFITNFDLMLVIIVLILSFIGKVLGCGLGAYWSGMKKNESMVIGFGMNSRGAMEIILATLGLQFGLIPEKVFVALVIMALFTSLTSAPFMNYFLKERKRYSVKKLINTNEIIFSYSDNKWDVIKELTQLIASKNQLNESEIYDEVKSREELSHTGVGNYLAIPHARMNIKKPYAAIAVNKKGIVFDVFDTQPVHLVVLLLTPTEDSELQLQIIAEIANTFGDEEKISAILKSDDIKKEIENIIS